MYVSSYPFMYLDFFSSHQWKYAWEPKCMLFPQLDDMSFFFLWKLDLGSTRQQLFKLMYIFG